MLASLGAPSWGPKGCLGVLQDADLGGSPQKSPPGPFPSWRGHPPSPRLLGQAATASPERVRDAPSEGTQCQRAAWPAATAWGARRGRPAGPSPPVPAASRLGAFLPPVCLLERLGGRPPLSPPAACGRLFPSAAWGDPLSASEPLQGARDVRPHPPSSCSPEPPSILAPNRGKNFSPLLFATCLSASPLPEFLLITLVSDSPNLCPTLAARSPSVLGCSLSCPTSSAFPSAPQLQRRSLGSQGWGPGEVVLVCHIHKQFKAGWTLQPLSLNPQLPVTPSSNSMADERADPSGSLGATQGPVPLLLGTCHTVCLSLSARCSFKVLTTTC